MNCTPNFLHEKIATQLDYVIGRRRWMHENPELSNQEFETSAMVAAEAERLGLKVIHPSPAGLIVIMECAAPGKTILLRADMDALPIDEDKCNTIGPKISVSQRPGIQHACGHDMHTAMLMGVMRILNDLKTQLCGRIIFCFEDGEETCIGLNYLPSQGAGAMMRVLADEKIDTCFAMHVYTALESGKICVKAGPRMAGIITFEVELTGKGGHGSRPDQAINPIFAAAYTLTNLANAWVNEIDVTKTVTLGLGTLNAGQKPNIIPETASFSGTIRFFDIDEAKKAEAALRRIIEASAVAHRCRITRLDIGWMGSCTNDESCSALAEEAVTKIAGSEVLADIPPWFASESFSYYLKRWPGVMAHLGIADPKKGTNGLHHNPLFDVDEDTIPLGMGAMLQYALDVLNG